MPRRISCGRACCCNSPPSSSFWACFGGGEFRSRRRRGDRGLAALRRPVGERDLKTPLTNTGKKLLLVFRGCGPSQRGPQATHTRKRSRQQVAGAGFTDEPC